MTFASVFDGFQGCTFVERTFDVDPSTLQYLDTLYSLPDHLHRAVLKRQVEFLAGRVCAQQALERLTGHKPAAIPLRPDRSPGWPPGIIGSITHTKHYAAALVASETHYQGLGIDCEVVLAPENLALQKHICVATELDTLRAVHGDWPPERLLTLVFSAKESLYKCLYHQVQAYFGFSAARVMALDSVQGTFVIQLEQNLTSALCTGCRWTGQFERRHDLLMTAILYPT